MHFRGGVVAMAVMVTLAACSSGGDEAGPVAETASTAVPTPPSSTAPTSGAAPPSSAPSATVAGAAATTTTEAVTASTVAVPEATTPPTESTLDPNVQARLDVIQAVQSANAVAIAVVRDPTNDAKAAALADHFEDPLLQGWRNTISRYRADGLREFENSEEPDAFVAEPSSVLVDSLLTKARVQGCSVTSGVVVETAGNPDGTDRVVENGVSRTVIEFELYRRDGQWKVARVAEPEMPSRAASCD